MKHVRATAEQAVHESRLLTPFDSQNSEHVKAIAQSAEVCYSTVAGTEAIVEELRREHGVVADRATAFDALCHAAELSGEPGDNS